MKLTSVACQTIKGVAIDIRRTPGTALMNDRSGQVIYTPPDSEALIRDKLANWEQFLHAAEEIDPLVRMRSVANPGLLQTLSGAT